MKMESTSLMHQNQNKNAKFEKTISKKTHFATVIAEISTSTQNDCLLSSQEYQREKIRGNEGSAVNE